MRIDILHPADQLVMLMDRIYKYDMTTTSGGNLSILDDNDDIWITPGSIDKGSLTRKDIIQVKPDGTIIGIHKPSVELPFHQIVYKKRPDVKAVLHAHPPALVSFSAVRKLPNTRLIPNVHMICGEVGIAKYGLPGSQDLGDKIVNVFEKGYTTVILENHGVVVAAEDLFKAYMAFETLDFCARLQINAKHLGNINALSDKYLEISKKKQHKLFDDFKWKSYSSKEREARREMAKLIHRAYDKKLFTSTQGTFSTKLDNNSFIITPFMKDRKYLKEEDFVTIIDGKKEEGKIPSRSVDLHREIYAKHEDINSIIISHPPNIMAFAVSDEEFDSKIIPESYILLRKVLKIPFGSSFMQQSMVADMISKSSPVVLVDNDCAIVTGKDLLNAFDRLEVLEYTAKAVISAKSIGETIKIDDEKIKEIEEAFKL
jgi:L-fuculose-phosphate aldolase